jgi:ubiquitin-protein ligase
MEAGDAAQLAHADLKAAGHALWQDADTAPRNLSRLDQDMGVLLRGLPLHADGSVFVAQDFKRPHYLKALVVGPVGSPYEGGCFEFDLAVPPEYPQKPPLCKLVTTGRGSVRFNANLYQNGKVCLSLLGTWQGPGWDPAASNLLQVVESIPFNIMVGEPVSGHPWFNEPGYADQDCPSGSEASMTPFGAACSAEYNRQIRRCTLKFAMIEALRRPPAAFAGVVKAHFLAHAPALRKLAAAWADEEGFSSALVRRLSGDAEAAAHCAEALRGVVLDAWAAVAHALAAIVRAAPAPADAPADAVGAPSPPLSSGEEPAAPLWRRTFTGLGWGDPATTFTLAMDGVNNVRGSGANANGPFSASGLWPAGDASGPLLLAFRNSHGEWPMALDWDAAAGTLTGSAFEDVNCTR